ncbi:hypothetical protein J6X15_04850 [Candidatus Saccharibacteria bacterium]|nr:hypothetical protein [Candidatus Saccharibacteria bacterium]MBP5656877.1 hypothetical protein [Candidatus Saccharibacteria bacterium]
MDGSLLTLLIAIVAIGVLLLVMISLTKKRAYTFDKENYQVDFLRIENSLQQGNEATYAMAIIQGDKLLDKALCEMGVQGRTMGDRLKKVGKEKFSELNAVWYAHKLRNQIAHESDFHPEYRQAQHALATYKRALKDLGAI